jgi:tRNA pseudouridine13 synthase
LLLTFFSPNVLRDIIALYNKVLASRDTKGASFGKIKSNIALERAQRTQLHQSVRRIFSSRLETETDRDGAIVVSVSGSSSRNRWGKTSRQTQRNVGPQLKRKSVWEERGGEYLHFTLYKENKDTMEVISFLAKQLRIQPKSLQFAGTKDRRAVTVQRISAYRLDARKLAGMNKILYGSKVGDFGYSNEGLSLGDLAGNEFVITLRDCKFRKTEGMNFQERLLAAQSIVKDSVQKLEQNGFLNYYGLQRFGTFSTGTHEVGVRMLQSNFKDACQKILSFSPEALAAAENPQTLPSDGSMISSDDIRRAVALDLFRRTGQGKEALERLPRKFSAEAAVIRHLSQEKTSTDWQGALQMISRPLRLMYVHAYQSFIWNIVAGERWKRWGSNVVEGDLVLVHDHGNVGETTDEVEEDENGEVVIHAQPQNSRGKGEQEFERARPLSKEEVASGNYSIFDIVLATPGFDVIYPANSLASFYKEFMGSERGGGLDPYDMRRTWKDISLSGSYRKLIGRVKGLEFDVRPYVGENEQMVMTDFERLEKKTKKEDSDTTTIAAATADVDFDPEEGGGVGSSHEHGVEDQRKIAVVVKFQLGTSQYATMALRELMKDGGAVAYKPEYGGGR